MGHNTDSEEIFIDPKREDQYKNWCSDGSNVGVDTIKQSDVWLHIKGLDSAKRRDEGWEPCPYYDQRNKGILASHTIFNYSNFLLFELLFQKLKHMQQKDEDEGEDHDNDNDDDDDEDFVEQMVTNNNNKGKTRQILPIFAPRDLLILDEGHLIEQEVVKLISVSIAKRTLQKYTDEHVLTNTEYDYDDSIEGKWLNFLNQIADQLEADVPDIVDKEIKIDAEKYLDKIKDLIDNIKRDPTNWMVSAIHDNNSNEPRKPSHSKYNNNNKLFANDDNNDNEVTRVDFKPLDVSHECRKLLNKCDTTLTMSATILDIDEYCKSVGLDRDEVKFIQVAESEFPVESRLIYELDAIEVTQKTLQYPETWDMIAQIVDYLMNKHRYDKGIIHVTTYKQLEFIKANISEENRNRLIETYIVDSKFRDLLSKNKGKVPAWFMESIRDGSGIIIDN